VRRREEMQPDVWGYDFLREGAGEECRKAFVEDAHRCTSVRLDTDWHSCDDATGESFLTHSSLASASSHQEVCGLPLAIPGVWVRTRDEARYC